MINTIFLGAPGVGKGTVAVIIAKKFNLAHVSTGNLFRQEIASASELGLKIKSLVESGSYVEDAITNEVVKKALSKLQAEGKSFILDGYPRTLNQVQFLESLEEQGIFIKQAIALEAPEQVILERLTGRRNCPKCQRNYHISFSPSKNGELCENDNTKLVQRKDDEPSSIKHRLEVYAKQTMPLMNFYKSKGLLSTYNANKSPDECANDIIND